MSMDLVFENDPNDIEKQDADAREAQRRMSTILSENWTNKWKKFSHSDQSPEDIEARAKELFNIPDDEDVRDFLFRAWNSKISGNYYTPGEAEPLVISQEVLFHFGDPPYSEILTVLQDSFREAGLFVGYSPRPAGDSMEVVFFLEQIGKQHNLCHRFFGKKQEDIRIESLKEDPDFDAMEKCDQGMKALYEYSGDNAVNPRLGRFSSDTGFFFFPYSVHGRQLVFFIDAQSGDTSLYRMGNGQMPEKILFQKDQVSEAFSWLLRLTR